MGESIFCAVFVIVVYRHLEVVIKSVFMLYSHTTKVGIAVVVLENSLRDGVVGRRWRVYWCHRFRTHFFFNFPWCLGRCRFSATFIGPRGFSCRAVVSGWWIRWRYRYFYSRWKYRGSLAGCGGCGIFFFELVLLLPPPENGKFSLHSYQ